MTRSFKALTLAGVAVIGLGVMPGIAAAGHDNGYRGKGGRGYGYERSYKDDDRGYKRGKYGNHGRKWRKKHARRHKGGGYKGHGHKKVVVHKYKHKHKNDNDYLLPFLAIGAVGLTAAFLANQSQAAPPRSNERVIWNDSPPPPAYVPAAAPARPSGPASTCVMTREYQTQVAVGGKLVEAYGQACLQPDGSWYHGPAQPVPY